jgi:isoquinoline 1-oxidoreductase beta subunit
MSPVSRRFVLTGAALTSASLLVPIAVRPACAQRNDGADYEITDWVLIAAGGQVTLGLSQPEVGQGSYTALPQILADELDADWQRVKVRFVTGKAAYKIAFRQEAPAQKEGASMSTTALYQRLRIAGAAARDVLVRAAAQRWNIAASACRTENGVVINSRGARVAYGQLCGGRRQVAAQRGACPEGPEPVSPDRQAGGAAGYARQVQRQRGVRHRRRGAGNAERRDPERAFL